MSGSTRIRLVGSWILLATGVICVVLGVVLLEARRTLLTPDGLAASVDALLTDPRVSAYVAERVTGAVLEAKPDLTAFKPMVAAVAQGTVSSPAFRRAVRSGVRGTYAALESQQGRNVVLSIPDVGALLRSAATHVDPTLAERIPPRVRSLIGGAREGAAARTLVGVWRLGRQLAAAVIVVFLLGAMLVAGGLALARDRRRAFLDAAVNLVAAGVFLVAILPVGRWLVQSMGPDALSRDALAGAWTALTAGIRSWGVTVAAAGLVLAASAHSLLERLSLFATFDRARHLLQNPPGGVWGRLTRSLLVGAVGLGAVGRPDAVAEGIVMLVGGACLFLGARELIGLFVDAIAPGSAVVGAGPVGARWRRVGAVLAAVLVIGLASILATRRETAVTPVARGLCNGSAALCGKRLSDVTFAGAHNAMSAADVPGWMFPQHEQGVAGQLADGVRAFLIDVHYGRPVGEHVKTDLDAETTSREKIEEAVGKEGVDAAMRIRDRFAGAETGSRGLYLCHGFCELGAQPLGPWLTTLYDFLVQHPDDVVVLVVEDYVSPQDLAAEFERAGLSDLVYRGPARAPWPTLQELSDTRQRVLVLSESGRPGVSWIHGTSDVVQETPYKFKAAGDMSCAPNRGGASGSLFLINNWIDTTPQPKPSNAVIVNAYDALLARARRCSAERGVWPTILAVDFYRTGDLARVVAALNAGTRNTGPERE